MDHDALVRSWQARNRRPLSRHTLLEISHTGTRNGVPSTLPPQAPVPACSCATCTGGVLVRSDSGSAMRAGSGAFRVDERMLQSARAAPILVVAATLCPGETVRR